MTDPRIRVVQGANAWRLIRTDRDGASRSEIPQMAAAAVRWWLRRAQSAALHELVATGSKEWRFGDVRPLQVIDVARNQQPRLPTGTLIADRHTSVPGTIPTVRGERPWWVSLQFWWRRPTVSIPFPGLSESLLGRSYQLNSADWVLDRAVAVKTGHDPGDATWGQAQGDAAARAAEGAAKDLGNVLAPTAGGLGLLAVLWLLSKR